MELVRRDRVKPLEAFIRMPGDRTQTHFEDTVPDEGTNSRYKAYVSIIFEKKNFISLSSLRRLGTEPNLLVQCSDSPEKSSFFPLKNTCFCDVLSVLQEHKLKITHEGFDVFTAM